MKEHISPSLYPRTVTKSQSWVSKFYETRCDICMNYMVFEAEFTCTTTGKTYQVRGHLTCKNDNVKYLITGKKCKQRYVGSVFESSSKPRFRVCKSDINAAKDRCGVAGYFSNNCTSINKF